MIRRAVLFAAIFAALLASASCRPKGSDKPATLEATSTGHFIVRHPSFEGHFDPKVVSGASKLVLKIEYSGFPEKSSATIDGKPNTLARSGELATSIDLTKAIGDAPIESLTGSARIPLSIPFELSFWDGRQKVSGAITSVSPWLELRSCLRSPPCPFPSDGPPSSKPNIVHFARGDTLGQKIYGTPQHVRDIDWVAVSSEAPEVDGKKCSMKRIGPGAVQLTDEYTLKRESETITVYDRRLGTKLHTKTLVADDRCPIVADIALSGPKAGLRSELTPRDRERIFEELRDEAPPAPTPQPSSRKPRKPAKK